MKNVFQKIHLGKTALGVGIVVLAVIVFGGGRESLRQAVNGNMAKKDLPAAIELSAPASTSKALDKSSLHEISPTELTIVMAGDVMFDRRVRYLAEQNGYDSLLSKVALIFKSADIAVANLEGPITSNLSKTLLPGRKITKDFSFTFDPQAAVALKDSGISFVSLANNHTDNFGYKGFLETKKFLGDSGIGYFGDPWNISSTESVVTKNGIAVAFVGYNSFLSGFDHIIASIKHLSDDGDFVIVMPHWGEEYVATSSAKLREQAQALVSAGAKAIVGSHPHVIMDNEWIGGVPVYYSLGNLLFDQYFSAEVMKGDIVELHLVRSGDTTTLDRVRIYETSLESRKDVTVISGPSELK